MGVVIGAMLAIQLYAKRGIQAGIKMAADDLSPFRLTADPGNATNADPEGEQTQLEGIRYESGERANRATAIPGKVLVRESAVATASSQRRRELGLTGGAQSRTVAEDATTTTGALGSRGAGVSSYSEVVANVR